jgi:hypothetical protein
MIRQIVIEAELPDDAQSMFRLSINTDRIAKGVTATQASYLVGEVLGGIGLPEDAETVAFEADGDASESCASLGRRPKLWERDGADGKRFRVQEWREKARASRRGRNLAAVSKTHRPAAFYRRLAAARVASVRDRSCCACLISGCFF